MSAGGLYEGSVEAALYADVEAALKKHGFSGHFVLLWQRNDLPGTSGLLSTMPTHATVEVLTAAAMELEAETKETRQ